MRVLPSFQVCRAIVVPKQDSGSFTEPTTNHFVPLLPNDQTPEGNESHEQNISYKIKIAYNFHITGSFKFVSSLLSYDSGLFLTIKGVVMARYGQSWKDVRRFSLSTLRDLGLGKKSLAERVTEEAGFLCSAFKSKGGRPFNPHLMINNAVSNVICSIVFGDRFEYDDKNFLKVLTLFEEILKASTGILTQLTNVIPTLIHVPGVASELFRAQDNIFTFLRGIITEHKATWDPNLKRDFIDAFLEEVEKTKGDPNSAFCEINLLMTVGDLFTAGTETTSTTLRFGLLYMMLYPDIQNRVQEEIDQVIGRERKPTMDDRANMPYTNAVVHEIQRYSDIIPLGVPHKTSRDTDINGFFIPKDTLLMFNLSSVLKDESVWARPYQFYPEHFLDADGQFIKRDAFMPFSAGRRICLGEQLARMELFLFFTTFLQQFTFFIPRDQPRPMDGLIIAFILETPPIKGENTMNEDWEEEQLR
ncbi:hypothetical protein NDU88_005389 [Pleurodeles waltl]|uniref:Uncharacterized protein n=1 Tax=Pleurodeles waltl TaxID=8319 RepID=A0AAV7TCD9_PLEWA|nr:hypothetical protein NDU88_005389 [Pleurodeles waltl]